MVNPSRCCAPATLPGKPAGRNGAREPRAARTHMWSHYSTRVVLPAPAEQPPETRPWKRRHTTMQSCGCQVSSRFYHRGHRHSQGRAILRQTCSQAEAMMCRRRPCMGSSPISDLRGILKNYDSAAHGRWTPIARNLGGQLLAIDPRHQQLELLLLTRLLRIKPLRSLPSGPPYSLLGGTAVPTRLMDANPPPRGDNLRAARYGRTNPAIAINAAPPGRAHIFQKFSRDECPSREIGFPGVGGG